MSTNAAIAVKPNASTTAAHQGSPRNCPMIGRSSHASPASISGSLLRSRVAVTRHTLVGPRPNLSSVLKTAPLMPHHDVNLNTNTHCPLSRPRLPAILSCQWSAIDRHLRIGQFVVLLGWQHVTHSRRVVHDHLVRPPNLRQRGRARRGVSQGYDRGGELGQRVKLTPTRLQEPL